MATVSIAPPVQAGTLKRKSTSVGLPASGRPVKRRASKACQCCRSRKVRCDVVDSGIPCTNCRLDEVECLVTEGKRRKKSCIDSDVYQTSPTDSTEEREDLSQFPMFDDIDGLQDLSLPKASQSLGQSSTLDRELSYHKPHMLYQTQGHRITPEERTRRLSILSARGIPVPHLAALTPSYFPPFTPGNSVRLPSFVTPIPNHILAEDIDYLQKKGAFLIPEPSLRNELLRNYVQYVHPYLPLLELEDFLRAIHKDDGSSQVSLLLFQAAMFAATAYIDMRYLTAQGYDSRKAARKAFFQRTKLLYDFDYENDRVVVVQAVLLMTYWYESPDDPKDVWHWLGIAISLARTIGINCNTSKSPLSQPKQKLWKRIWWSCYMRDRLVAIGMRRPIRIRHEEFDVPMLEISDFETEPMAPELNKMIGGCSVVRDASKRQMLASMCISVVKGCQCITKVLSVQYSILGHRLGATQETTMRLVPRTSAAETSEVLSCDEELEQWYRSLSHELRYFSANAPRERNIQNDGEVINLHRALLTGIYMTASSALHRPQMMPAMPNLVISPQLKELSKRRVREAASAITDIFRDLYFHDLIRYLPNTGVSILLPAIIVHLLDIKSPDSATRQLSVRRFQFCMQALQKLRDIYASADFAFSFLDAAIRKVDVPVHDNVSSYCDNSYSTTKDERKFGTSLTPPPETLQHQVRSPSVMQGGAFYAIPTTTLCEFDGRRDSLAALTPPCSDKLSHFSEVAITGGAAVTLTDFDHMHYSPASSVHDALMHSNGGYMEAEQLMDDEDDIFASMIDEEAMKNDFDQLVNLEGGSIDVGLFSESLVNDEISNQVMAVLLPAPTNVQTNAGDSTVGELTDLHTAAVKVEHSQDSPSAETTMLADEAKTMASLENNVYGDERHEAMEIDANEGLAADVTEDVAEDSQGDTTALVDEDTIVVGV